MSIKTILTGISGGSASDGAIELSCQLAKKFGAHLEGLHVRLDPLALVGMASVGGYAMPMNGDWVDRMNSDIQSLAEKMRKSFDAALKRHGIAQSVRPGPAGATAAWRDETGYAPTLVAQHARFFDLVILGRSERVVDQPSTDTIEETLLQSGRPLLIAPAATPETFGEAAAIGWNGSVESVRAVDAALPLLEIAKRVVIITIGDKSAGSVESLRQYLDWHGITAAHRATTLGFGSGPGDVLLATAREENADLLIMGGYGHGPWREMIFGGASRELVGVSRLPLLMCH
jgi:nucleotide-binding universal stress UspA family protein